MDWPKVKEVIKKSSIWGFFDTDPDEPYTSEQCEARDWLRKLFAGDEFESLIANHWARVDDSDLQAVLMTDGTVVKKEPQVRDSTDPESTEGKFLYAIVNKDSLQNTIRSATSYIQRYERPVELAKIRKDNAEALLYSSLFEKE